jgi:peptide/nickel transport system substrate-binding protein
MKFKPFVIAVAAVILLTACGGTDINSIIERSEETPEIIVKNGITIGTSGLTGEFSPFFAGGGFFGDAEVMRVINAPLVTLDRRGAVVRSAATGEIRDFDGVDYEYEGIADIGITTRADSENPGDITTTLTFSLREDVFFSDGVQMTASDLIFTLYVLCDVDYGGTADVSLLPIEGLGFYRTNADSETYERYHDIALLCLEAMGSEEETDFDEAGITEEQYDLFYECYREAWLSHVNAIIDYCARNYADYAQVLGGSIADEWVRVALAMLIWMTADFDEDSRLLASVISDREWNLRDSFPTAGDLFEEFYSHYDGELEAYINAERIGSAQADDPLGEALRLFIARSAFHDGENTGADSISGIRKVGDFEVSVTLTGQVPWAVYSFAFPVAPLHYYGDLFIRGNLNVIRGDSRLPLGAGAYRLISFDGAVAELEANEYYFKGVPKTARINFVETEPGDMVFNVAAGEADIVMLPATREALDEADAYGTAVKLHEAYYGHFGYIGFNAERVNADGEPLSEASINFRKGLAVILAAYREISIRDFYGDSAEIAEYPVSGVSWTAPRRREAGFVTAYSASINGAAIFYPAMTETQRIDAAKRAALGFFEAAGCEVDSGAARITAFPEETGNPEYEIYVTGYGIGRHPSHLLLTMAAETLRSMNINVSVKDVRSQGEMFEAVMNGDADMWCAAWYGEIMPGLDKAFLSGGSENFFGLSCEVTDSRINLAKASLDAALYRNVLDSVLDSAVIIPVYQRKVYFLFGAGLSLAGIEGNLTAHYNYADIIHRIALGGTDS